MPMMSPATGALMTAAMMVAMMLPSVAPTVWRHHRHLRATRMPGASGRTALFAAGYAAVWGAIGLAMFAVSGASSMMRMVSPTVARFVPWTGAVVLGAGVLQLTRWKTRQLHRCSQAPATAGPVSPGVASAWWSGCRLGVDCGLSCAGPMAVLLVAGLMDARVMVLTTAAITAERVAPGGVRIARLTGALALVAGLVMCARAIAIALPPPAVRASSAAGSHDSVRHVARLHVAESPSTSGVPAVRRACQANQ